MPVIDANTLFGFWTTRPVDVSLQSLLTVLDKHQVDRACTISTKGLFSDHHEGNDQTWQAAQQDKRLIPVATVDPGRYLGVAEEIRERAAQGFPLFALFPESQEWSAGSACLTPVVAALAAAKKPVMVEARQPGAPCAVGKAFTGTQIPVILMGVGSDNLAEALAVAKEQPNVYLETHLLNTLGGLELVASEVGADRLIFGSRAPLHYFSSSFLLVKYSGLSEDDKNAVLGGNLSRLLGVS